MFATKSIGDGGDQTMSTEQIQQDAAKRKTLGLRTIVHAHASGGARSAIEAGCTAIEHGTFLDDATAVADEVARDLFRSEFPGDQHYLGKQAKVPRNRELHEEGFGFDGEGSSGTRQGTANGASQEGEGGARYSAVAGGARTHSEEFIYRVKEGNQPPMDAIVSGTSLAAESLGLGTQIGSIAAGYQADIVAVDGDVRRTSRWSARWSSDEGRQGLPQSGGDCEMRWLVVLRRSAPSSPRTSGRTRR